MARKVTNNANECAKVENDEVQLQRKVPARPSQLRLKTEHYYNERLPTYEESQEEVCKVYDNTAPRFRKAVGKKKRYYKSFYLNKV